MSASDAAEPEPEANDDADQEFARARRKAGRRSGIVVSIALVVVVVLLSGVAFVTMRSEDEAQRQAALDPFYAPPEPLPAGAPGDLIRSEPVDPPPGGGRAWRVLYLSTGPNGDPVAVSGLVMVGPDPAPEGGRPVVAWAHGTTGMAPSCAPSRARNIYDNMPWLADMLAEGWVVTATDYYGLGTPGTLPYLMGESAGHDVLNSVRVAQQINETKATNQFATWGHSQGGHASLWAGQLAAQEAPELELVGITAAAPAAELVTLVGEQWNTLAAQVLGPYVAGSWPVYNDQLDTADVLTPNAQRALPSLVDKCLVGIGLTGVVRERLGEGFFSGNPADVPVWRTMAEDNTPSPPGSTPTLVAQGTDDTVVLPDTTRELVSRFCAASTPLTASWFDGVDHLGVAKAAAPEVITWIGERFAGQPSAGNCPSA